MMSNDGIFLPMIVTGGILVVLHRGRLKPTGPSLEQGPLFDISLCHVDAQVRATYR